VRDSAELLHALPPGGLQLAGAVARTPLSASIFSFGGQAALRRVFVHSVREFAGQSGEQLLVR
jgi:hypothetical protein